MADGGPAPDPVPDAVPVVPTTERYCDGSGFEARVVEIDGIAAVVVTGEIDMATADLLRQALDHARTPDGRVLVDLAGTTFIDSCGLAVLVRTCEQLGGRDALTIHGAGPGIRRLVEISGVDGLLTMVSEPLALDRRHPPAAGPDQRP
jgi:anti-sigma B factor antagonist